MGTDLHRWTPADLPDIRHETTDQVAFASGGGLGLQDGRRLVEVGGWLRWKSANPVAVGQDKPSRPSAAPRWVGRR